MHHKVIHNINNLIKIVEIVIAIIVAVGVIMGLPDLIRYIYDIVTTKQVLSYEVFGDFLKHVLMLIVGLELMIMILSHSYESILTLVLFVIARKMLVYAESMLDILIGTVSISLIFIVLRFLLKDQKMLQDLDSTFAAAMPLAKIRKDYGYDLPAEMAHTIGGLMYELAKIEGVKKLKTGIVLQYGDYRFTLITVNEGTIERVRIETI